MCSECLRCLKEFGDILKLWLLSGPQHFRLSAVEANLERSVVTMVVADAATIMRDYASSSRGLLVCIPTWRRGKISTSRFVLIARLMSAALHNAIEPLFLGVVGAELEDSAVDPTLFLFLQP